MSGRRLVLTLAAAAALVTVLLGKGLVGGEPAPQWSASFEREGLGEWSWWRRPELGTGEIALARVEREGIPARDGDRVVRFSVSPAQRAEGRRHAKLYREWAVRPRQIGRRDDAGRALERLPGEGKDASGTYRASFFIPRGVRWDPRRWSNIMQFKLVWSEGGALASEPQWWVDLMGAEAWADPPRRPDGSPSRPGDPVLAISNWTERRADGGRITWQPRLIAPPVGRWFEISARVEQGRGVAWALDGETWYEGDGGDWPAGLVATPTHARDDFSGWIFGIGLYGGPGVLYADDASFTPPG